MNPKKNNILCYRGIPISSYGLTKKKEDRLRDMIDEITRLKEYRDVLYIRDPSYDLIDEKIYSIIEQMKEIEEEMISIFYELTKKDE